jgi:hypothetical protein
MKTANWVALATCFLIVMIPISASAQDNNYLGISFGTSDMHLYDEHASPLIFKGIGIAPDIIYYHKNKHRRQYAEASFYHKNLKTSQDNFSDHNYNGRVRITFVYSILKNNANEKKLSAYLGSSIQSFFSRSDYFYQRNTGPSRSITSWYWCHSVDLSALLEYQFDAQNYISSQLFIPLISNISRPAYSSSGDYNYTTNEWDINPFGETLFFPQNISFNAKINYQKPIGAKTSLQLSYEFFFASYYKPRDIKMYMNNLRIGLFYNF